MNATEETFGRALLILDEVIDRYGDRGIGRTAMSLANEIGQQYTGWKYKNSESARRQLHQQETTVEQQRRQGQQQEQTYEMKISDRLNYSLKCQYDVPSLPAAAPTFAREAAKPSQSQEPTYESSVFICLEDYGKCRRTNRSELCLSLLVLCVAKELIPFVKR